MECSIKEITLNNPEKIYHDRNCDTCAECCKGWLHGSAMGRDFYPGKPCYFLQKTCSIYENRPINPCKSYKCHWLDSDDLPMWMRPDMSKALITCRNNNGIEFFEVTECGQVLQSKVLSWLVIWALNNGKNLRYQIEGGWNKIGSKEFMEAAI